MRISQTQAPSFDVVVCIYANMGAHIAYIEPTEQSRSVCLIKRKLIMVKCIRAGSKPDLTT